MQFIKKFKKAVKSTYMCIRYPFLYPRNRFTGLHYNNWKLHEYHVNNYGKATKLLTVHIVNVSDCSDKIPTDGLCYVSMPEFNPYLAVKADIHEGEIRLRRCRDTIFRHKIIGGKEENIFRYGFKDKNKGLDLYIIYNNDVDLSNEKTLYFNTIITDGWLWFKIKVADFLNDYVLQIFHCIPTYTEWDALKQYTGWYNAFGDELLREMKKQLKKDKMLYKFRITDIKEKYGALRIYTGPASTEMFNILNKYENISYETCIECGKPAKYLSGGWICPYCEDHFNLKERIPYATMVEGKWVYDERY